MTGALRRPTRATAEHLADELARVLMGRRVDRVWRPGPLMVLVRFSGRDKRRLLVDLDRELVRCVLTRHWPETPDRPDQVTLRARAVLEGRAVEAVTLEDERGILLALEGGTALHVQLAGRFLNIAVTSESETPVVWSTKCPARDPDSPPLPHGPCLLENVSAEDWLDSVDDVLSQAGERLVLERRRISLDRGARGLAARTRRALEAAERDLARAESADMDRRYGELLKINLHLVKRGAVEVQVPDYMDPSGDLVVIPLEPSLDGVANMERFFKRYRRFRDAAHRIRERQEAAKERLERLVLLREKLGDSVDHSTMADVETVLRTLGWRPASGSAATQRTKESSRVPYQRFLSTDGLEILVGRTASDNENLTFRVARGKDIWLHARDVPGSHVILRRVGGGEVSPQALLDAATLAAWHSRSRGEAVVDVQWTERKHVRKAPGQAPGRVLVSRGRNIAVRVEQSHVDLLYGNRDRE